jgi:hypothetical protein
MLMRLTDTALRQFPSWLFRTDDFGRPLSRSVISLALISLTDLPTRFFSGSAEELRYTRADRRRDPEQTCLQQDSFRSIHVDCTCIPHSEAFPARWICRGTTVKPA